MSDVTMITSGLRTMPGTAPSAADVAAGSIAPNGQVFPLPAPEDEAFELAMLALEADRQRMLGRQIVVVQGLGFVGAAVSAVIADARDLSGAPRHFVIGVDRATPESYWKVATLAAGGCPVASPDAGLPALIRQAVLHAGNLRATSAAGVYALADVIVVDVPLDVTCRTASSASEISIGLDGFMAAIRSVGRAMRPDALVLIETTVPPGATEQLVWPALMKERAARGITAPLRLAHSYERVMPGPHYVDSVRRFWRTFAGIDAASASRTRDFLASYIDTERFPLWELATATGSELAKLLENSYRAVNIALVGEWTQLAEQAGVNLFAVIESIRVRQGTHDNLRLPGFGVGGYCLTKDSLLAQWAVPELIPGDVRLELTLRALEINYRMPLHTLNLARELADGSLLGRRVAVCGVSYLPEVGDTRNSPTELLVDQLLAEGAEVVVHDPCVASWRERPQIVVESDLARSLDGADVVLLVVGHRDYLNLEPARLERMTGRPCALVDAHNLISDETAASFRAHGWRLAGVGKGHWRRREYQCAP
jgi:UDP-N-acetyl-D-glucosamine dehydrogenase